jgi:CHAT domain-containing protein/tetratricopeptide (TPR) repeat protein
MRLSAFVSEIPKRLLILLCVFIFGLLLNSEITAQNVKPKYEFTTPALEAAQELYAQKNYEKTVLAYDQIIQRALAEKNFEEAVFAMERKANSLRRLGKVDQSIEAANKAIQFALEHLPSNHFLRSKTYLTRGEIDHRLFRYYNARAYMDTALINYDKVNTYDSAIHYRMLEYKYYAYQYSEGSQDTLLKYLGQLMEIEQLKQQQSSNPDGLLYLLENYVDIYLQKADFDRALAYAIRMSHYVSENRINISNERFLQATFRLAQVLYNKKIYDKSIEILERVMPFVELHPGAQRSEYHDINGLIGLVYIQKKRYAEALTSFNKALDSAKHSQSTVQIRFSAYIMGSLAIAYLDMKDYTKSKQYINESLKIRKLLVNSHNKDIQSNYNYLGNLYFQISKWKNAVFAYDSGLRNGIISYSSDLYSFPNQAKEEFSLQDLWSLKGKAKAMLQLALISESPIPILKAAENYAEQTHQIIVNNKEGFFAAESKIGLSENSNSLYATGTGAALELYSLTSNAEYIDKALAHMSRGKSQLLLEQMGEMEALKGRSVPENLRQEFVLAIQKIDSLDLQISALLDIDPLEERLPPTLDIRIAWNDKLDSLKPQVAKFEKATEEEVSVESIRKHYGLKGNKAFVEYLDSDSLIYALAISEKKVSFRKIIKDKVFYAAQNQLLNEVSKAPQGDYSVHLKNFGESSSQLYNALISPITEDLGKFDQLIIVPDGKLNSLPFELLVSDWKGTATSFKDLNYLMTDVSVTHLLSSKLAFQNQEEKKGKGILGFGYVGEGLTDERSALGQLPGALEEIAFLKSRFTGDYFIGDEGTKQQFLKEADDYDIIHLAIHGKSDTTNRFKSSLVFNGEKDYYLTSTDLYQTNLSSRLAVLSACETSIGQLSKGEGTFSIARGFTIAGVPSIVTTLWKVNDAAASKISQQFYENLEEGMTKDNALRKAKLQYLQQSDKLTESPFYWGHYVLIGDPSSIELPSKTNRYLQMLLALMIIMALAAMYYLVRKRTAQKTIASY